jgi:hypothetical protein
MKTHLKLVLILPSILLCSCFFFRTKVAGEMFVSDEVTTNKLGAVWVYAFSESKAKEFDGQLIKNSTYADYRALTDSEGRFNFSLPNGRYILAAETSHYKWRVPVDVRTGMNPVSLNSSNMAFDEMYKDLLADPRP